MNQKFTKTIAAMVVVLCSLSSLSAQFSGKIGVVSSTQIVEVLGLDVTSESKLGFQLGILYTKDLSDAFQIRPGLQFTQKGAEGEDPDTEESVTVNFNYLEIPVDFRYKFPIGDYQVAAHLGPYFGYLLSASDGEQSSTEGFKRTELGLNLGAEFLINQFSIGLNYSRGLSNIQEESVDFIGDITVKNAYTAIYGTYSF